MADMLVASLITSSETKIICRCWWWQIGVARVYKNREKVLLAVIFNCRLLANLWLRLECRRQHRPWQPIRIARNQNYFKQWMANNCDDDNCVSRNIWYRMKAAMCWHELRKQTTGERFATCFMICYAMLFISFNRGASYWLMIEFEMLMKKKKINIRWFPDSEWKFT